MKDENVKKSLIQMLTVLNNVVNNIEVMDKNIILLTKLVKDLDERVKRLE